MTDKKVKSKFNFFMSGRESFITEGMAAIVIITASHGEKGDKNNGN